MNAHACVSSQCFSLEFDVLCGEHENCQAPWVMLGTGAYMLWVFLAAEFQGAFVPDGQAAAAA